VRLTPCRRKLLEARRTNDDFSAAKRKYDHDREKFELALDTWSSDKERQIQGKRQALDWPLGAIAKKADVLINKSIEKALKDIRSGHGRRASASGNEVCSKNPSIHIMLKESLIGNQGSHYDDS
jgi:hypothetical protein